MAWSRAFSWRAPRSFAWRGAVAPEWRCAEGPFYAASASFGDAVRQRQAHRLAEHETRGRK